MNNGYLGMWDGWSKRRAGVPVYDNWLDEYREILDINKEGPILDLGCGLGANTLYLKERGYEVLAADFSEEALKSIRKNIGNVRTMNINMLHDFPLKDELFFVIIADLSLHYFDDQTTKNLMKEIKRVLKRGGVLLARVARIDDYNFGACEGEELEHHFYFEGAYTKRFFDDEDVRKYFSLIGDVSYDECSMVRDEEEYSKEKKLYKVKVTKR